MLRSDTVIDFQAGIFQQGIKPDCAFAIYAL